MMASPRWFTICNATTGCTLNDELSKPWTSRDRWRIEWRRQRLERQGKTMPDLAQGSIATFHGITFTDSSRKS